jgi:transcription antitermination factor NusG
MISRISTPNYVEKNTVSHKVAYWYAIYTRSRFEKKINGALLKKGFTTFLPLIKEKRKWSDRLKTIEVPLLPGYVFVKIWKEQIPMLYTLPGFVRIVSFEGNPCKVKEKEISLLKKIVQFGFKVQQVTKCDVGDEVEITRGPFRGWHGKVEDTIGNSRIIFQFDSFQQGISVEVNLSEIEKICPN